MGQWFCFFNPPSRSRFGRAPSSGFYEAEARDEKMWFNSPTL